MSSSNLNALLRAIMLGIKGGEARKPLPLKGATGPGPSPFDAPSVSETVGIADIRRNPFQEAAKEAGEQKRLIDPESQRTSAFDEAPERPGQLEREVIEEVTGPPERVTRTKRSTMEEMDNLFGEEEARQVENIRKTLSEQGIKRSRIPTERDRAEALNVARDEVRLKEVDQTAKKVFDQIEDLERTLLLPKASSQAERRQVGQSRKLLQNFKREAAQTAAEARKTKNPALLNAILDRLVK